MIRCPHCASDDIEQTGRMDAGYVTADSCQHDFECWSCGCLFLVEYHAILTKIVDNGDKNH